MCVGAEVSKDYNRGRKEAFKEIIALLEGKDDDNLNPIGLKLILLDKVVEIEKGGLFGSKSVICGHCGHTILTPKLKVRGILAYAHCPQCDMWTLIKTNK